MRIRLAEPHELELLPDIERSAAEAFRGSSQDAIADDGVSGPEVHFPFQTDGLVLVAEADGRLIGFATCQVCADALHLWELAVRAERQGQGAGRGLMAAVEDLARERGCPAVTLSTFREIPWNAPFYARLGFVEIPALSLNRRLLTIIDSEAGQGLDVENRCAMRLAL